MTYSKIRINIDEDVNHHDKVIHIDVMGDPWYLAHALNEGKFKVTIIEINYVEQETELEKLI